MRDASERMAPTAVQAPQALGAEPEGDVRQCMFCGRPIADRGLGFLQHLDQNPECQAAYDAWLERLDQDRPGG